jgi:uncharacterized protein YndB with AHSA1/START domain
MMKQDFTETQMRIRKPVAEIFEAFIDPEITRNFWFTRGSGRLELNRIITWEWEMYNLKTTVKVKEIVPAEKIVFEWDEPAKRVEMNFKKLKDDSTYITIKESGYMQTGDELIRVIKDSTGGFTTVLDGLKAYLEHHINLRLIEDKFPAEIITHGK